MPYICPICQAALSQQAHSKSYQCPQNHHFDCAKEGYLNLLPAQHKKSKEPGDSRAMMRARRDFLEAGFYQPLAHAIVQLIDNHKDTHAIQHILDMGCGEGYYSRQIEALSQYAWQLDLHGLDIAKNAISAAAKKQPNARFIVASSNNMPYAHHFFDLILRVYAPSNDTEINRLLKPGGLLLIVTPGPRHLWQLKEFIYQDVKEHQLTINLPSEFETIESQRIRYTIQPDPAQRMALLHMTPFAWRANSETQDIIKSLNALKIETDFILTLASKLPVRQ